MPKPISVVPTTALGRALEEHRHALGMTRAQAYRAAGCTDTVWTRLLREERRFEPSLLARAARAVGMELLTALRLAKVAVVPDNASQVLRESEMTRLAVIPDDASRVLRVSEVIQLKNAS